MRGDGLQRGEGMAVKAAGRGRAGRGGAGRGGAGRAGQGREGKGKEIESTAGAGARRLGAVGGKGGSGRGWGGWGGRLKGAAVAGSGRRLISAGPVPAGR